MIPKNQKTINGKRGEIDDRSRKGVADLCLLLHVTPFGHSTPVSVMRTAQLFYWLLYAPNVTDATVSIQQKIADWEHHCPGADAGVAESIQPPEFRTAGREHQHQHNIHTHNIISEECRNAWEALVRSIPSDPSGSVDDATSEDMTGAGLSAASIARIRSYVADSFTAVAEPPARVHPLHDGAPAGMMGHAVRLEAARLALHQRQEMEVEWASGEGQPAAEESCRLLLARHREFTWGMGTSINEGDGVHHRCVIASASPAAWRDFMHHLLFHRPANSGESPTAVVLPIALSTSHVSPQQYRALVASVDVVVLPTRGEGWGRPLQEAMAVGVPVIVTNWSGPTALVSPHTARLLPIVDDDGNVDDLGGGEHVDTATRSRSTHTAADIASSDHSFEVPAPPWDKLRGLRTVPSYLWFTEHRWAEPAVVDLRRELRWAAGADEEELLRLGAAARVDMGRRFDVDTVAALVAKAAEDLAYRKWAAHEVY
jgi:hypothetical protein